MILLALSIALIPWGFRRLPFDPASGQGESARTAPSPLVFRHLRLPAATFPGPSPMQPRPPGIWRGPRPGPPPDWAARYLSPPRSMIPIPRRQARRERRPPLSGSTPSPWSSGSSRTQHRDRSSSRRSETTCPPAYAPSRPRRVRPSDSFALHRSEKPATRSASPSRPRREPEMLRVRPGLIPGFRIRAHACLGVLLLFLSLTPVWHGVEVRGDECRQA